ncbi:MAG: hypothetical protein IPM82_16565 [Saprospiraceae bacterium]|nr:hypothetical protein [Saprospiraceae bacterium]
MTTPCPQFSPHGNQTLNLGYGLHSQMQPLPMYFLQVPQPDGSYLRTNENRIHPQPSICVGLRCESGRRLA